MFDDALAELTLTVSPAGTGVKRVPWWALVSATGAPVVLVVGLTVAASRQPAGYDPVRDTISALAARGATDRWVMTAALVLLGLSHATTAAGMSPGRRPGRCILAGGGVATVLVAAFAQPVRGNSVAHTIAAAMAFGALSIWPLFAAGRRNATPLLTRLPSVGATAVMLGFVLWFVLELHGGQRGLAERAAACSQALWPLAVVLSNRLASSAPAAAGTSSLAIE